MKKLLSWLFVLVILTGLFTPCAFAGRDPEFKNVKLSPTNGSRLQNTTVSWSCSGTLTQEEMTLGWAVDLVNPAYYRMVRVELYRLVEKRGAFTWDGYTTVTEEQLVNVLYSKDYNSKKEVSFSASGTISLTPGSFRIKIIATMKDNHASYDYLVKETDFTVAEENASPATSSVTVRCVDNSTEELLHSTQKNISEGITEFYAPSISGYTAIHPAYQTVSLLQNGTVSPSVVTFRYIKNGSSGGGANTTTPPATNPPSGGTPPATNPPSGGTYDIGIPNLNGNVYYENDMNVYVLWVQYQLKATGQYYQGDNWDETGNLGNTTMKEIAKFMKANGYSNHNGRVDQTVINTLANYLGSRRVPVYAGGFYEKMNTIMMGGSAGSMQRIDANSGSTKIKWVQACLKKLGYYNSSIDGRFGSVTIRALKSFQTDYGYVQRDYVSLGVARTLLEACYYSGCYLNDLP